jgi:hypothetical protein
MGKKISRLARPKTGRHTYSHSLSLTSAQIEFLSKQENASELVRKILDDLMAMESEIRKPETVSVISLKHKIELLEQEERRVYQERTDYWVACRDKFPSRNINADGTMWAEESKSRKPITPSNPEQQYHLKILLALKAQYDAINSKIQELKEQVIKSK